MMLVGHFVGGTDLGAATFTRVIEGMLVHFVCHRIVDDVDPVDTLVMRLDPGIDPERLDANDLLLFVGHRTRNVHHVDHAGNAFRFGGVLPAADIACRPGSE